MTELDTPLPLKKGDRFFVITTTSYIGQDGKRNWICEAVGNTIEVFNVVVNPGESFMKDNGEWQDWKEMQDAGLVGGTLEEKAAYSEFGIIPMVDNFRIKVRVRYN